MKRIFFYFLTICLSYFLLEISSFAIYFITTHKLFAYPKHYEIKKDVVISNFNNKSKQDFISTESLHPYLGYVRSPGAKDRGVSDFGFEDSHSPIQKRSKDKIVIGIFGGSVADQVSHEGIDAIKSELKNSQLYVNKEFIFLNFAIGGYKQPQQLLALNYLLALGGAFDIVINLDGFNEMALPVVENIPRHVFPFYPRAWYPLVSTEAVNFDNVQIIYEAILFKRTQEKLARIFSSFPLRYSITANLFYDGIDHFISNEIAKRRIEFLKHGNDSKRYDVAGPSRQYKNDKDMYEDFAMVWKNSSLQMSRICASNHMAYFHFLQPNQYVPNSKIIKKEESRIAISKSSLYKKPIENGYPYLRQAGKGLIQQGVNFTDLTFLFAHDDEILYKDACCHLNEKGVALLGQIIGETIVKETPLKDTTVKNTTIKDTVVRQLKIPSLSNLPANRQGAAI